MTAACMHVRAEELVSPRVATITHAVVLRVTMVNTVKCKQVGQGLDMHTFRGNPTFSSMTEHPTFLFSFPIESNGVVNHLKVVYYKATTIPLTFSVPKCSGHPSF